jgi:phenylpropionate dioxygenase-like ring-hydroxylating dioxygenase large terminal subunit
MTTQTFHRTATTYRQGATTMPRERYVAPDTLAREFDMLFAQQWNCIGRSSAIAEPGSYVLADVAGESIIVLRDNDEGIRAFFNVCRHRGTRLCMEPSGNLAETIQCPYHAWTYGRDGHLAGAPHMQSVEGFDREQYSLHAAAVAEWEGFLFVNIAESPVPFETVWAPMIGRLSRFGLDALQIGHRASYEGGANWKLVFQNYSECLHCPMIHPELNQVLPYQSGANDLTEGPFLGGYMELTEGMSSATMSGEACGRILSDAMPEEDRRRAYYYTMMPNLMLSVHPDYVNYYIVHPLEADRTLVTSEWLFHPDNAGDDRFDPDDAIGFWDRTNRQDWDIIERGQMGISSRRYVPGPYSPRESIPAAWDREYLRQMGA